MSVRKLSLQVLFVGVLSVAISGSASAAEPISYEASSGVVPYDASLGDLVWNRTTGGAGQSGSIVDDAFVMLDEAGSGYTIIDRLVTVPQNDLWAFQAELKISNSVSCNPDSRLGTDACSGVYIAFDRDNSIVRLLRVNNVLLGQVTGIDVTQYHTYRVIRQPGNPGSASLYIDDMETPALAVATYGQNAGTKFILVYAEVAQGMEMFMKSFVYNVGSTKLDPPSGTMIVLQ